MNRLRDSTEAPFTGKVQDVVQLTAQNYGINSDEQEGILKYLIEGGDLSLYVDLKRVQHEVFNGGQSDDGLAETHVEK